MPPLQRCHPYIQAALVGAWGEDANGSEAGAAYVFTRVGSTWVEQVKLLASDGAEGDHFGLSVALSHSTALVGAPLAENGAVLRAAYIFGAPILFEDGFESGDTSAWSTTVP